MKITLKHWPLPTTSHRRIVRNLMAIEIRCAEALGAQLKARPPRKVQR